MSEPFILRTVFEAQDDNFMKDHRDEGHVFAVGHYKDDPVVTAINEETAQQLSASGAKTYKRLWMPSNLGLLSLSLS